MYIFSSFIFLEFYPNLLFDSFIFQSTIPFDTNNNLYEISKKHQKLIEDHKAQVLAQYFEGYC